MALEQESARWAGPAWGLIALLSIGVAGYALAGTAGVLPLPPFVGKSPDPLAFRLHMVGGAVALLLGAWQFRPGWNGGRSPSHRWLGVAYLVAVLSSGMAGLWLARVAQTGLMATLGFGGLALAWLGSAAVAWQRARARRYQVHRHWMLRNFALTLAAVSLRIQLPLGLATGVAFEVAYPVIAWACWVPNLLVAEWWIRRQPRRPVAIDR